MSEDAASAIGKHFYSRDTQLMEVETKTPIYLLIAGRDGTDERVAEDTRWLPALFDLVL